MAWWKTILQTTPLIFAGYEVGKNDNNKENTQELVEYFKTQNNKLNIEKEKDLHIFEIIGIIILTIVAIAYIIELIVAAMNRN